MRKNISVWLAFIAVIAVAAVFFISLGSGGSVRDDALYTDLMAFPAYAKNGYEPAYINLDPRLIIWDLKLPAGHNGDILMSKLPKSPYSATSSEFLSINQRTIEDFTITIPFELNTEKIASLYGDNPIAPGMYLAGIGENWEIYINGELIAKQIYIDSANRITSFRSQRGVSIPFDKRFLNDGVNQLVIHIIGARSSLYTGLYYTGPYYIGDYAHISNAGTNFLSVALCTFFIVMGFYHILLYFLRKTDLNNLLFGIFSILLAVYYFTRSTVIYQAFADTATTQRIECSSLYLLLLSFAVFLENLNFGRIKKVTIAYGIFCAVLIVSQSLAPIWFTGDLLTIWVITGGAYIIYIAGYEIVYIFVKSISAKHREPMADGNTPGLLKSFLMAIGDTELGNIFIPMLIVFLTAIYDLLDEALLHTGLLLTRFGFALLMLCMAFILARKYTNRFEETTQMNEILESTVKQRTQQLEVQVQIAETASRAKSEFLSNMSHEIRTPMNAILGMTSIGEAAVSMEQKDHSLARIKDASIHLLGIINDILDVSKIESGKFELSMAEFDFEKMLKRVVNVIGFRIEEKKHKFSVYVDREIPRMLIGDDQRLAQVITNLLGNAIKFTPERGSISIKTYFLGEEDGVCKIRIAIADTGIGISPEQQSKLFVSFQQAESNISRKFGGTGLGLSISKSIVEMMGGEVAVESELGKGAVFSFTAKLRRGETKRISLAPQAIDWKKIRVLVVDDDKYIVDDFQGIVNKFGAACDTARSGDQALELFDNNRDYNLIFTDWQMPGMDGIELASELKKRIPDNSNVVLVMMSSGDGSAIAEEAKAAGVSKFFQKPLFPSTIEEIVSEYFNVPDEAAADKEENKSVSFEGYRILLAEDLEINREIVLSLLEPTHIGVDCAVNGRQAVEMFAEAPERCDLIFMDMQMPDMDGLTATTIIRAMGEDTQSGANGGAAAVTMDAAAHIDDAPVDPGAGDKARTIPIIAMTANVFREDVDKCLAAGMNDHIGKPLDFDEVLEKLKEYLPTAP